MRLSRKLLFVSTFRGYKFVPSKPLPLIGFIGASNIETGVDYGGILAPSAMIAESECSL